MPAETIILTPEALLDLPKPPDGKYYELSDGELIVVGNAGALHEWIKNTVRDIFTEYQFRTKAGRAFSETQFTLRVDRARIPDVAWVSRERLSQIPWANQTILIAPDVAVEVISESERQEDAERKLHEYMEAGVEVWQVFPSVESVTVWRGHQGTRLEGEQTLTSERMPGFSVAVSEFFRRP